jgi:3'-5' exonuclease
MQLELDKIIFYDIETDFQWAPYAQLRIIGYQIGLDSKPEILDLNNPVECQVFKDILANPEWTKVHFNGINFDEIVLNRYGFWTNPENRHDVYLMAKTCHPALPAYGLKFLNCYFFSDWHESERLLRGWCALNNCYPNEAPIELQHNYCKYDVAQTARLFKMYWPIVHEPNHWMAYTGVELPFGEVLHEMMLEGGDYVNIEQIEQKIGELTLVNIALEEEARTITNGKVTNPNSTKQVAEWLKHFEQVELETSLKGNLICRKDDLLTLLDLDDPTNDTSRIARICFEIRSNNKQLGYLRAFHRAAKYELESEDNRRIYSERKCIKIPKSYSLSGARTRRFTSSSRFGINFQNEDKATKSIELIPPGWLGCFIDETQIENVFHIYASKDLARRKAYEGDTNYNEYVWLANQILDTNYTREELDKIPSSVNPSWSVYKQYKTCKLAMNFGMGVSRFAATNGLSPWNAKKIFEDIHEACPAIRLLQRWVEGELITHKFIQDPFGHIYSGPVSQAYKVLAYFIQGCGTGSIPKVMARAIYDRLHKELPGSAVMCGTTHDEIAFRIRVADNAPIRILDTIKGCLHDCEGRFSYLFDNIPLRAKLSLSVTNAAKAEELNHYKLSKEEFNQKILEYIERAK